MNNDLRWMSWEESESEIQDGEHVWFESNGRIFAGQKIGPLGLYGFIGVEKLFLPEEHWRICRALVPQPPTNVGER